MSDSQKWKLLLEEDDTNELVVFSLAKALLDEKEFAEAERFLEKLTVLEPEHALGWAMLARCRLQLGKREAARAAVEAGMPIALRQRHETPELELRSVLDELDGEF